MNNNMETAFNGVQRHSIVVGMRAHLMKPVRVPSCFSYITVHVTHHKSHKSSKHAHAHAHAHNSKDKDAPGPIFNAKDQTPNPCAMYNATIHRILGSIETSEDRSSTATHLQTLILQFLDARDTLVGSSVDGGGHGEGATDDGAETRQEACEGLGALFSVDDFHGGDVLWGVGLAWEILDRWTVE